MLVVLHALLIEFFILLIAVLFVMLMQKVILLLLRLNVLRQPQKGTLLEMIIIREFKQSRLVRGFAQKFSLTLVHRS